MEILMIKLKPLWNKRKKHYKIFEKEDENHFNDCRDKNIEEKEKYNNEKLSQLPIHQLIKQIKVDELLSMLLVCIHLPRGMKNQNIQPLKWDMLLKEL